MNTLTHYAIVSWINLTPWPVFEGKSNNLFAAEAVGTPAMYPWQSSEFTCRHFQTTLDNEDMER